MPVKSKARKDVLKKNQLPLFGKSEVDYSKSEGSSEIKDRPYGHKTFRSVDEMEKWSLAKYPVSIAVYDKDSDSVMFKEGILEKVHRNFSPMMISVRFPGREELYTLAANTNMVFYKEKKKTHDYVIQ